MKKDKYYYPAKSFFCDRGPQEPKYEWVGWGPLIRHLREWMDVDQSLFGRLLRGYTRPQIARYEKEAAEPPLDFWIKFMKTFGLNLNWVFSGEGVPYVEEYENSPERERFMRWTVLSSEKREFLEGFD